MTALTSSSSLGNPSDRLSKVTSGMFDKTHVAGLKAELILSLCNFGYEMRRRNACMLYIYDVTLSFHGCSQCIWRHSGNLLNLIAHDIKHRTGRISVNNKLKSKPCMWRHVFVSYPWLPYRSVVSAACSILDNEPSVIGILEKLLASILCHFSV